MGYNRPVERPFSSEKKRYVSLTEGKGRAMQLQSIDIPQADSIHDVLRVLDAVRQERVSPREIGEFLGGKVGRQGNYYVHAARILGLVTIDPQQHTVSLTPNGRALRTYDPVARQRRLRNLVAGIEPMRSILQAMAREGGLTEAQIGEIVAAMAPISGSTVARRVKTIVTWLRDLDLIAWDDVRWCYAGPRLLVAAETAVAAAGSYSAA